MIEIKFQVRGANGNVNQQHTKLRDAVLDAARYDGWGAIFRRDEQGVMRLLSSPFHIGNNPYFPKDGDAFQAASRLEKDEDAEADVAAQICSAGVLHSRYSDLAIVELTYDGDVLTHIDGRSLADLAAEFDDSEISVETVRSWYGEK